VACHCDWLLLNLDLDRVEYPVSRRPYKSKRGDRPTCRFELPPIRYRSGVPEQRDAGQRAKLTLEYDGSGFAGWARQHGKRTVEDEVARALAVLLRRAEPVKLTVAGRTDAGVHAAGQVASYAGPPAPLRGLNALLPDDVAALACVAGEPEFDARRDATSRAYCYRILTRRARPALARGRVLHWPHALDRDALDACAAAVIGIHDFTAFTPTETAHTRFERQVLTAFWQPGAEHLLEFWIEADAFMQRMNRVLVGTMLEVAGGDRPVASFVSLLKGRPRAEAGVTAPARGLYLEGVGYRGERVL
jgi:tRNA pseudouridine38-40 synthase